MLPKSDPFFIRATPQGGDRLLKSAVHNSLEITGCEHRLQDLLRQRVYALALGT